MDPTQRALPLTLLLCFLALFSLPTSRATTTAPMKCTDTARICTSFLAFMPKPNTTLPLILSMFDVAPEGLTLENRDLSSSPIVFVRKNCSCDSKSRNYLTATTFTVREVGGGGGYVYDLVGDAYNGLAYLPIWVYGSRKTARVGEVVGVRLFCGCSNSLWNYLMSYVMDDGDSVASLASRFGVTVDSIMQVNGIAFPDNFTAGSIYYIPLNIVPGEPYLLVNSTPPAPSPALSTDSTTDIQLEHRAHVPYGWILRIVGIGVGFLGVVVLLCICLSSSVCCRKEQRSHAKGPDGRDKFHILQTASSCCTSGRDFFCGSTDWKQPNGETNGDQINITKVLETNVFELEKPVIFNYEEILTATEGFSEANLLGHGKFGSVYYGVLHNQEVAVKRMTATKSREFTIEMKVLCKVHHANLVEFIGYAASGNELFLIFEYAQKGSLRNYLHDPHNKGQTPLSWIMRVQIALDAARGLEYIHEHTKDHYVHRDIKTSNILLDGAFRAKISDFGLSKLVGKANETDASATRVVGTFGYLAPEYLSEGLATTKSDVYAFGVVLFELISGREAAIRMEGLMRNSERRSLVSIMLAAVRNVPDSRNMANMKDHIDPNLMDLYPRDCVFKIAFLAKQCVDEDPILRPDMKQLVISLSQILLSSIEWEATLAGNSHIFSGLVQGR